MKMKFKRVHQLGYVVEDMDKAMDEYGKIYGIKAWYRAVNEPVGQLYYKGQPFTDPGYDVVLGYCGKTEIELITTGGAENIYTAFIRAHGYGLHHFCFFVRDIKPYVAEYEKRGWVVTQNGVINGKSTKSHFAYLTRPNGKRRAHPLKKRTRLRPFAKPRCLFVDIFQKFRRF